MRKVRKDPKGMVLRTGETYHKARNLYSFSYMDVFGKRKFLYAGNLIDLREKEEKLQRDKLDKLDVYLIARADINFVFDRLISAKSSIRNTTKSNYVYNYDRYVRKGFGKKKISDVHFSDVMMFYGALLEKGLSVNTIDSIHTVLHQTFNLAVRDNVLRNNPAHGAMAELKRKMKDPEDERTALTIEQQRAFLEYLERPENLRWKPIFTVMFGTGCRVGEIIGLRWSDIDLKNKTISINHNVTYYPRSDHGFRCEFEVNYPKTEAGIRTVPMLDKVYDAFLLEKKNQKESGIHPTMEIGDLNGFIFCNRFGGIHKPSGLNRALKRIICNYNLQEDILAKREHREPIMIPDFSCHITRHTFCTRLCESDTNVKVIQSVMGHKDIQTTLNIYAEVSEQKKKEVFKNLNNDNIF